MVAQYNDHDFEIHKIFYKIEAFPHNIGLWHLMLYIEFRYVFLEFQHIELD